MFNVSIVARWVAAPPLAAVIYVASLVAVRFGCRAIGMDGPTAQMAAATFATVAAVFLSARVIPAPERKVATYMLVAALILFSGVFLANAYLQNAPIIGNINLFAGTVVGSLIVWLTRPMTEQGRKDHFPKRA